MKFFLVILLVCKAVYVFPQQYLPNGDFVRINQCCEYHVSCAPMGWWTSSGSTFNFEPIRYDNEKNPVPQPALIRMRGLEDANERSYIQAPILCPLKEGEEYVIELEVSFRGHTYENIGILLSDSFIHIPKRTVYQVDTLTGYFRAYSIDSLLPFEATFLLPLSSGRFPSGKQHLRLAFRATGKEKFILAGNFLGDEGNPAKRRFLRGGKDGPYFIEVHKISLTGVQSLVCDCNRQEEIVDGLNRRHTFFGRCDDSLPIDMNHLFRGVEVWDDLYAHQDPVPAGEAALLPFEPGKAYRIERIYFEFDSAVLMPASYPALDSLAVVLLNFASYRIEVMGHTDSFGTGTYNQELSEKRAAAVMEYLIHKGIDPERIRSMGFGSSQPLRSNSTKEGRQENRRVEFILREEDPVRKH